jgi:inositol phosphorylceramide mannosyltransferase catalytic subunit
MPTDFVVYGLTWLEHHPDWRMYHWDEQSMAHLEASALFPRATSPSQIKDLAAPEILHQQGGVYLDCDFECLRPIHSLLSDIDAFAACEAPDVISTGILGCVPGHQAFERLAARVREVVACSSVPSNETGPGLASKELADITLFGPSLFYPFGYDEPERREEDFPDAYARHHWAASWL